jgi:YbgC/YbaW family acyl-CoA thioester hydrolase
VLSGSSTYRFAIRANDIDSAGHINNSVYFEAFEAGRWDWANKYLPDIGHSITAVVSSITVDYLKPIVSRPNEYVDIRTNIHLCQHFSIYFIQKMIIDEKNIATAKVRVVPFDIENNKIGRAHV